MVKDAKLASMLPKNHPQIQAGDRELTLFVFPSPSIHRAENPLKNHHASTFLCISKASHDLNLRYINKNLSPDIPEENPAKRSNQTQTKSDSP